MLYFVPHRPVVAAVDTILPKQGVEISLKIQGLVSESSGGGQAAAVHQRKATVFLEMKSSAEVRSKFAVVSFYCYRENLAWSH